MLGIDIYSSCVDGAGGSNVSKLLRFKVFYSMDKGLSGELS